VLSAIDRSSRAALKKISLGWMVDEPVAGAMTIEQLDELFLRGRVRHAPAALC
jgi:hypothetical protein